MRVLLDTCVLSEMRRSGGSQKVREAVDRCADEDLFLSVLTIGELAKGIALLDASRKKSSLQSWLSGIQEHFAERIVPIDGSVTQVWGELTARLRRTGIALPAIDGLIAATVLNHGLHLMTRNTRHFEATGVMIVDPWQ